MEKEIRKEVDDAIAKAKVNNNRHIWSSKLRMRNLRSNVFQDCPMPEPSELFTNVYVKGFGTEVLTKLHILPFQFSIIFSELPCWLFFVIFLLVVIWSWQKRSQSCASMKVLFVKLPRGMNKFFDRKPWNKEAFGQCCVLCSGPLRVIVRVSFILRKTYDFCEARVFRSKFTSDCFLFHLRIQIQAIGFDLIVALQ